MLFVLTVNIHIYLVTLLDCNSWHFMNDITHEDGSIVLSRHVLDKCVAHIIGAIREDSRGI